MLPPYQIDSPCLAWADQGVLLAEVARSRGLDWPRWAAQAGLAVQPAPPAFLSPRQLLALLAPLQALGKDMAFVIGGLSLPGHYGLASQALQEAGSLEQALQLLAAHGGRLSPLLAPRLLVEGDELILYWVPACGLTPSLRGFVVDMQMAAVAAMSRWLGEPDGQAWCYSFNRTRPRDLAPHMVHLGGSLAFDCQVDALRLPLAQARRPWPAAARGSGLAAQALAAGADAQACRSGLLAALYQHLLAALQAGQAPSLDEAAAAFGTSPATLKRQLALAGSHYQAELDQVRAHLALYLLSLRGLGSEAVAARLGFHDRANFRRAFKRWTGITPGALPA